MDVLEEIIESRFAAYQTPAVPLNELKDRIKDRTDFRDFYGAVTGHTKIIAEIKRGSPSKGMFAPDLNPCERAKLYTQGGAACLSVLTEPMYFFGSLDDLMVARQNTTLPVLRKDFIVTEYQVYETALYADCILLIARCLPGRQLSDFFYLAQTLGLDVLVEVFDDEDIEKVAPYHFPLIGINNRNLATMDTDIGNSLELLHYFSPDQTLVAASGIRSRQDIEKTMQQGITAFLIGEALSVSSEPVKTLREFIGTPMAKSFFVSQN